MYEVYLALTFGESFKLESYDKSIVIEELFITCNTENGAIVFTNGSIVRTLYLKQGFNESNKWKFEFLADSDVLISSKDCNLTAFVRFNRK